MDTYSYAMIEKRLDQIDRDLGIVVHRLGKPMAKRAKFKKPAAMRTRMKRKPRSKRRPTKPENAGMVVLRDAVVDRVTVTEVGYQKWAVRLKMSDGDVLLADVEAPSDKPDVNCDVVCSVIVGRKRTDLPKLPFLKNLRKETGLPYQF